MINKRLNFNQFKYILGNMLKRNPYALIVLAIMMIIAFILLITTSNQN